MTSPSTRASALQPLTVISRDAGGSMAQCELTCIDRASIDIGRIHAQHAAYLDVFRSRRDQVGHFIRIVELPPLEGLQDAMFVEDVALVYDDCAVITRPGATSRRPEVDGIVAAISSVRRDIYRVREPGTVDGGDVLHVGKFVIVGKSTRSNDDAFAQLREYLEPKGYVVLQCPVTRCLHLKSAVSKVCDDTVLLNPEWIDEKFFTDLGLRVLRVDPAEPDSANVLTFVSGTADGSVRERTIVVAAAFRKLYEQLADFVATNATAKREGLTNVVLEVIDVDEVAKAEGALTCCSLLAYGDFATK